MEEVRKLLIGLYCIFGAIFIVGILIGSAIGYFIIKPKPEIITVKECAKTDSLDWDKFIYSLAHVESNNNIKAVGSKNDVGLLQITPIMVKEANRIIGTNKYNLNHRFDSLKSIEIFNVIQDHYNKEKSPHKALKIWNPKAPIKYHNDVMGKYNEIK